MEKELIQKVQKYHDLTKKALEEIKKFSNLNKEQELIADDFLSMAENYFSDAKFFQKKGELLTALAAFSYAHAWLDAGVRAKLFETKNDVLFTLP
ncbi:MAG: DUF357 domain-containing protein [Candidatus Diapherotrites archaeon]|nr:DUF357 domain-containing protein [Candidatus Diapherotrites archaeon]